MKIVLIGAGGQLGTDLAKVFRQHSDAVMPLPHSQVDVRDFSRLNTAITDAKPDLVISTAAFHKVEECEKQPLVAFEVNAVGSANLARACNNSGSTLVFFSTDYVFGNGQRTPYTENHLPHPLNTYGVSKVAGEHMIAYSCKQHFIVRTCGLYGLAGSSGKGGNFVENILRKANSPEPIRVVNDQVLTPSYTLDVAETVAKLVSSGQYGTYHVSSEGECSWYEFTKEIFRLERVDADLRGVSTDEFPSPVRRPSYSVLSKDKLARVQITMPPWQDALARYLRARKEGSSRGSPESQQETMQSTRSRT